MNSSLILIPDNEHAEKVSHFILQLPGGHNFPASLTNWRRDRSRLRAFFVQFDELRKEIYNVQYTSAGLMPLRELERQLVSQTLGEPIHPDHYWMPSITPGSIFEWGANMAQWISYLNSQGVPEPDYTGYTMMGPQILHRRHNGGSFRPTRNWLERCRDAGTWAPLHPSQDTVRNLIAVALGWDNGTGDLPPDTTLQSSWFERTRGIYGVPPVNLKGRTLQPLPLP